MPGFEHDKLDNRIVFTAALTRECTTGPYYKTVSGIVNVIVLLSIAFTVVVLPPHGVNGNRLNTKAAKKHEDHKTIFI